MKKYILAFIIATAPGVALAQNWPPPAEQVWREEMAKALAEKARNDAIVRQQRDDQERQRRLQEEQLRWLQEAQRRANTG